MKRSEHKSSVGENEFLIGVARSIGSTLGAIAAKVRSTTGAGLPQPSRRKRIARKPLTRRHGSALAKGRKSSVRIAAGRVSRKTRSKGAKKPSK